MLNNFFQLCFIVWSFLSVFLWFYRNIVFDFGIHDIFKFFV